VHPDYQIINKPGKENFFSHRIGREFPIPVALQSKGAASDSVTLHIKKDEESGEYFLRTAYIGFPCPNIPYNIEEKKGSAYQEPIDFWSRHALVYDKAIMGPVFESSWNEVLNKQNQGFSS